MSWLFRALSNRLRAFFAAHAARDPMGLLPPLGPGLRMELLRRAARYEAEGLHAIAHHLRQQAEAAGQEPSPRGAP
jgi:hypothetical protein